MLMFLVFISVFSKSTLETMLQTNDLFERCEYILLVSSLVVFFYSKVQVLFLSLFTAYVAISYL